MPAMRARGFTLLELMIVVAIVGVLAAVALPTYRDYVARAQTTEALNRAAELKARVSELYVVENTLAPADSGNRGLPLAAEITSSHIELLDVTNGLIEAEFATGASPQLAGKRLRLSPTTSAGGITWTCTSPDIEVDLLPASCR